MKKLGLWLLPFFLAGAGVSVKPALGSEQARVIIFEGSENILISRELSISKVYFLRNPGRPISQDRFSDFFSDKVDVSSFNVGRNKSISGMATLEEGDYLVEAFSEGNVYRKKFSVKNNPEYGVNSMYFFLEDKVESSLLENLKDQSVSKAVFEKHFTVDIRREGITREFVPAGGGSELVIGQNSDKSWYFDWVIGGQKIRVFDFTYAEMREKAEVVQSNREVVRSIYDADFRVVKEFKTQKSISRKSMLLDAKYFIYFEYGHMSVNKCSGNLDVTIRTGGNRMIDLEKYFR